MTPKVNNFHKSLIINTLWLSVFVELSKARKNFILSVLCLFLSIKGRINFLQLSRYSDFCEQYFRIHFENLFNFAYFNGEIIKRYCSSERIVAIDPSYISKSGKQSYGLSRFWSGCAKSCKWGLEICGFAVVDTVQNTAFHLRANQTPALEKGANLLEYYGTLIKENYLHFKEFSDYLVADAYFSKAPFLESVLACGMHFISRLRDDADMRYLYRDENRTAKQGAIKNMTAK